MTTAREAILGRIRAANSRAAELDEPTGGPRREVDAPESTPAGSENMADPALQFVQRATDYGATVRMAAPAEVRSLVEEIARERGVDRLVIPPGLPAEWIPTKIRTVADDPPLSFQDLDSIGAVLTHSAAAIADAGAVVLDHGPDQGRRVLTLLPDLHVCVVRADRVFADVSDAITAIAGSIGAGKRLTLIAGPSATSDIELERVEGVHGPRQLELIVT